MTERDKTYLIEFLDDGTEQITEASSAFNYLKLKDRRPCLMVAMSIGFIARYAGGGFQIYEMDVKPATYFVSNVERDHDYFFSFLAEYYPRDLAFILFHPEIFRGEFSP